MTVEKKSLFRKIKTSILGSVTPLFSVSLVYYKHTPDKLETALRVLITPANSKEEALGKGLLTFDEEMKGFNLCNKVIIEIYEE